MEVQAREQLEGHGVPPCYPPHLAPPLENVPPKYQRIIEYWKSQSGVKYEVLTAQLEDWEDFQSSQARGRQVDRRGFEEYSQRICNWARSRAWDLPRSFQLRRDISSQDSTQTWVEFAQFHHAKHNSLTKRYNAAQASLNRASGLCDYDTIAAENDRDYFERLVHHHTALIEWIDEIQSSRELEPNVRREEPRKGKRIGRSLAPNSVTSVRSTRRTVRLSNSPRDNLRGPVPRRNMATKTARQPNMKKSLQAVSGSLDLLVKTRSGRVSRPTQRWAPA